MGAIKPPANEREIEMWLVWVLIVGGILLCIGFTIVFELLRKSNKKYAIDEKDERNQTIYSKAGYKAWGMNLFLIASSGAGLFFRGHTELVLILGILFVVNIVSMLIMIVYFDKKM